MTECDPEKSFFQLLYFFNLLNWPDLPLQSMKMLSSTTPLPAAEFMCALRLSGQRSLGSPSSALISGSRASLLVAHFTGLASHPQMLFSLKKMQGVTWCEESVWAQNWPSENYVGRKIKTLSSVLWNHFSRICPQIYLPTFFPTYP